MISYKNSINKLKISKLRIGVEFINTTNCLNRVNAVDIFNKVRRKYIYHSSHLESREKLNSVRTDRKQKPKTRKKKKRWQQILL